MPCCGMGAYGNSEPNADLEISRAWNRKQCVPLGWKNNVLQSSVSPYLFWAPGHPDGIKDCGSSAFATRVVGFQAAKGLSQDGKLGPGTLTALRPDLAAGGVAHPPPPSTTLVVDDSTKPWYQRQSTFMVGGVILVVGGLFFTFRKG